MQPCPSESVALNRLHRKERAQDPAVADMRSALDTPVLPARNLLERARMRPPHARTSPFAVTC